MLKRRVAQYIASEKLFAEGDRLLVALSGGADSVALLRLLLALNYTCEAVHCNFHLRGAESERDEQFVCALCEKLSIVLHVAHFDTTDYAEKHRLSIEMAARELRYNYFKQLVVERDFKAVVVAHHRNDSVETFLLNLVRGTGLNGLCGIRARNGVVVRPLLAVTRKEITDYLSAIGQDYVTDSTNLQDVYTRNKIRLDVLPLLETLNPSVQDGLAATAERLAEVAGVYNQLIENGKQRVVIPFPEVGEGAFKISIPLLQKETAPRSLLFELLHPLGFNTAQVKSVFDSLNGESGKQFVANDWCVLKDRTSLCIAKVEASNQVEDSVYELPLTGGFTLSNNHLIKVEILERTQDFVIPKEKDCICLDVDKLSFPLTLRRWWRGDKFVPFGMKGEKLLSDYMTDRKFSLWQKQHQWVVCSGEQIAWVVGERCDNRFRIDDDTHRLVRLTLQNK